MREKTIKSDFLKEKVLRRTHPSGMEIFFMPRRGYRRQFAIFGAAYGSHDNSFIPRGKSKTVNMPPGIAHFLEHQMFQMPGGNVFPLFAKSGADANAFTAGIATVFQFSSTARFYGNLDLLINFVLTPYFEPSEVDRERKVIEQEIRMYQDNADWRVHYNLLSALYRRHPVRLDAAGTLDSISKITPQMLHECHGTFYHPSNMTLVVAGALDWRKICSTVDAALEMKKAAPGAPVRRIRPAEGKPPASKSASVKMDVNMPKLQIGFKDPDTGLRGRRLLEKDIATSFALDLAFSRSSDAFNALYEKRLIDDTFHASYNCESDFGYSVVGGDTPNPGALRIEIFNALRALKNIGVRRADLDRIKKKTLGKFIRYFNSLESPAVHFLLNRISGVNLFDFAGAVRSIAVGDLQNRLETHLVEKYSASSVIMPSRGGRKNRRR
jgi:predicted Zn-dependent peptidase